MHQKQPPPNVASSVLLAVCVSIFLSGLSAVWAINTPTIIKDWTASFILFCFVEYGPLNLTRNRFEGRLHSWIRLSLGLVEMFTGRQLSVFLQMFRPQRFRDGVLLVEPLAEVNQTAALGAERAVGTGKPVANLLAGRAFDSGPRFHQ